MRVEDLDSSVVTVVGVWVDDGAPASDYLDRVSLFSARYALQVLLVNAVLQLDNISRFNDFHRLEDTHKVIAQYTIFSWDGLIV